MSVDIAKLVKRPLTSRLAMESVREVAARFGLEERERMRKMANPTLDPILSSAARFGVEEAARLRKLLNPALEMRSSIDRYLEDERRQRERYRDLFLPSTASAIEAMLSRGREMERFTELFGPSKADFNTATASNRILTEAARLAGPPSRVLDQLRDAQTMAAPWLAQMESAAELARKFIDSWPDDEASDDGVDWDALDQSLVDVQGVIQQLPPRHATEQQLQATGLNLLQWLTFAIALLGGLLQLLALMETREQSRFDREQAADARAREERAYVEGREFRDRLIATIEALVEHTPDQSTLYVVGTRPVPVKSAITRGVFLGTAHPNQVVVVIGRSGRWVKIRFRDNLEERAIEGWVLKHYLIRQPKIDGDTSQG